MTFFGDTVILKFKTANQYQLKLKIAGNLQNTCFDSVLILLQVYNNPKIKLSASKNTICLGNEIILNALGDSNIQFLNGILNNTAFKPSGSGKFTAFTADSNNCTDTATINITVNPTPKITVCSSASQVCKNSI